MTQTSRIRLDRIDLKILATLQQAGRMTNVQLAETIGLSASPCLERVRRLERAGIISGYRADLNLRKLGDFVTVFAEVTLDGHERSRFETFERAIHALEEAVECHKLGGGFDYLVRFVCRTMRDYQEMSDRLLASDCGIARYFTYVVIETVKPDRGVGIQNLLKPV